MTTVATGTAKSVSEQYGSAIAGVYDDIYGELDIGSPEAAALRGLALTTEEPRVIVELGVGTGRVLGALGRAVAGTGAARLIGIDGSADLLSRAAERYSDLDLAAKRNDQVGSYLSQKGNCLHGRERATRTQRVTQPVMRTVHPVDSDPIVEQLLSLQERRTGMRCVILSSVLDASTHVTAKVLRELFGD